ncbi:hypothetical protein AVEN_67777-1 [Araneus ventricosus]|uniref:Uncharacterized protein n=1 Tax=Araneus ventricosus TaxID=182803 RepID=A0A4Y2HN94_ARAVE|nr:hypothetical protein AVEN_67777-1 [Araneus ventricosus]
MKTELVTTSQLPHWLNMGSSLSLGSAKALFPWSVVRRSLLEEPLCRTIGHGNRALAEPRLRSNPYSTDNIRRMGLQRIVVFRGFVGSLERSGETAVSARTSKDASGRTGTSVQFLRAFYFTLRHTPDSRDKNLRFAVWMSVR